jgi:hypothetical protein
MIANVVIAYNSILLSRLLGRILDAITRPEPHRARLRRQGLNLCQRVQRPARDLAVLTL